MKPESRLRLDIPHEQTEATEKAYSPSLFSPLSSVEAFILFLLLFIPCVHADVAPVATRVPKATGWMGQRVPFHVDLRSRGTFSGTASFDLPQVPGAILMKIGEPLVETEQIEGEKWFVQRHEFALFSQKTGTLEIPGFAVRFARRDGYVGQATGVQSQAPGFAVEIRRPPGSDQIGFLITTELLEVTGRWDPTPGPAKVGDVFKRTIVQRAQQVTGMALAPAPTNAPDGIRVYPGQAATSDDFYRGAFVGERRETITYLMQKPGTLTLPALTYVWWNPKTEKLHSRTFPAVSFEVAPPPAAASSVKPATTRHIWTWLVLATIVVGLWVWRGKGLGQWAARCWKYLNPPEHAAARQLLRACYRNDAAAAATAWIAWRNAQPAELRPASELCIAVTSLHRQLFGPAPAAGWRGDDLACALKANLAAMKISSSRGPATALPGLNTQS